MWQDYRQTDLRQIAEQILGQPARRSTRYVQYHAPDRRDTSPSLTIWADGYKDFGGDASGDVFAFLSTYANLPFSAALQFLQEQRSVSVSESRRPTVISHTHHQLPSPAWQSAVSELLTHAQHTLWHSSAGNRVRAYLESQGYSPTTIQSRGIGLNLRWHRLSIEDEPIWVAPGILYPWRQSNTLYGVKIRLPYHRNDLPDDLARCLKLAPGPMKYMQIKGSCLSQTWYGEITDPTCPLILVEGEKDRDNLWQIRPDQFNVITLGSATGRISDALWPHLQQSPWIAIVLDSDEAGQSNALRLADHLNSRLIGDPAFTVSLPAKDLTDWLLSGADLSTWLTTLTPPSFPSSCPSVSPLHSVGRGQGWGLFPSPLTISEKVGLSAPPRQMERGLGGEVNFPIPTPKGEVSQSLSLYFPNGLPDPLREILLGLHQLTPQGRAYIADHSAAALVLELITDAFRSNHLSENSDSAFTIQQLAEISNLLNHHASPKTIRRGLDQLTQLGFVELIPFSTPFQPISNHIQGGENGNNSLPQSQNDPTTPITRGRPAQKYRPCDLQDALPQFLKNLADRLRESLFAASIPDTVDPAWFEPVTSDPATRADLANWISTASAELDQAYADLRAKTEDELELRLLVWSARLKWSALSTAPSTPIPATLPFGSGRAYRDAYYQAKVAAAGIEGRQISRAKAAAEIGVNSRTLTRVRERVGIVTEEQFKEFRLHTPTDILGQADYLAPWAAHRLFGRYLASTSGARIALHPNHPAYNDQWATAQLSAGHTLTLQIQVASREHLATPAEAHHQRQRRLEQYRTRCSSTPSCPSVSPLHSVGRGQGWGLFSSPLTISEKVGLSAPPRQMERGLGGEVNLSASLSLGQSWSGVLASSMQWGVTTGRFSPAYVRDQLALRLPYLENYAPHANLAIINKTGNSNSERGFFPTKSHTNIDHLTA